MRLSIVLYTTDPNGAAASRIDAALQTIDFDSKVRVSRTIGPANWFELNKAMLLGGDVEFPLKDIEGRQFSSTKGISKLARSNSVLTVSYSFTRSERLATIVQALHTDVPADANGFFSSGTTFSFGPSDIIVFTEDDEGQEDVELLDVAQFSFSISCDNYHSPRLDLFEEAVPNVSSYAALRQELEQIVGPLKLHFSY